MNEGSSAQTERFMEILNKIIYGRRGPIDVSWLKLGQVIHNDRGAPVIRKREFDYEINP